MKVKFLTKNFFQKQTSNSIMAMTKPANKFERVKKILDNNNLKILDSRWFLDESQKGLEDLKNLIFQMQFFLILIKILIN